MFDDLIRASFFPEKVTLEDIRKPSYNYVRKVTLKVRWPYNVSTQFLDLLNRLAQFKKLPEHYSEFSESEDSDEFTSIISLTFIPEKCEFTQQQIDLLIGCIQDILDNIPKKSIELQLILSLGDFLAAGTFMRNGVVKYE